MALAQLRAGETVVLHPRGNSMLPLIRSGERVEVAPIGPDTTIEKGDIVVAKVRGRVYVHLVSAVRGAGAQYQISNNHGHANGWVTRNGLYGKVVRVGDPA
jgi:phage repressor protein C with HTH and peptisase S24 domain